MNLPRPLFLRAFTLVYIRTFALYCCCRMHLKGAVSKHGGCTTPFMSMKGVTHVIAENLSAVKTDKAMKVRPGC